MKMNTNLILGHCERYFGIKSTRKDRATAVGVRAGRGAGMGECTSACIERVLSSDVFRGQIDVLLFSSVGCYLSRSFGPVALTCAMYPVGQEGVIQIHVCARSECLAKTSIVSWPRCHFVFSCLGWLKVGLGRYPFPGTIQLLY